MDSVEAAGDNEAGLCWKRRGVAMRVLTEAKRNEILKIASQVFTEMGYEGASMAEIATRVGGSRGTLYRYYPSKERLFLEVVLSSGRRHLEPVFVDLSQSTGDITMALQRYGEKFLAFICDPESLAAQRMVIAESGRSEIGKRFHLAGPKNGLDLVAKYLAAKMDEGILRRSDTGVAADHLVALLQAEIMPRCLMGLQGMPTRGQIKQVVKRAVAVFLAAYRSDTAGAPDAKSAPAH
jgi:AcrR family transcriptional regulator